MVIVILWVRCSGLMVLMMVVVMFGWLKISLKLVCIGFCLVFR